MPIRIASRLAACALSCATSGVGDAGVASAIGAAVAAEAPLGGAFGAAPVRFALLL